VVDDVNLGTIVYKLDRKDLDAGAVPSAQLINKVSGAVISCKAG
jgi:hypothetical protein